VISVCIPWGGACPYRVSSFRYVLRRYRELGMQVAVGIGDAAEWRKGAAVRSAVDAAGGDVLVIADCDVWSEQTLEAVERVRAGAGWAIPHHNVRRLTLEATRQFYKHGHADELELEEEHYGIAGGGIVVLHRDTYELAPIDDRFVGWGGEDKAWAAALRTLAGRPVRINAPLWHMWHPPQKRLTRAVGSEENDALRARYVDARMRPNAMRALIAEGRAWASNGSTRHP
jgi:hypothetical protein